MTGAPTHSQREPEIEILGRIARFGLFAFRAATVWGGAGALLYASISILNPPGEWSPGDPSPSEFVPGPIAPYFAAICIGLPPLFRTGWLFGRGRWIALAIGALLWFGPSFLEGDHDYGYVLRMFATLVAVAVLAVWCTLFKLTKSAAPNES